MKVKENQIEFSCITHNNWAQAVQSFELTMTLYIWAIESLISFFHK